MQTKTIAFRVPAELADRLAVEARKYGMSSGAYARRLMIDGLKDDERTQLGAELREIRTELKTHRNRFAKATLALLTDAGKVEVGIAREWVKKNIL